MRKLNFNKSPNAGNTVFYKMFYFITVIISISGCIFGVYGVTAARNAETRYSSLCEESMPSPEFDGEWQPSKNFWYGYGLHYDVLYPLDIECQKAVYTLKAGGLAQMSEIVWQYGDMWKTKMEQYLEHLAEEMNSSNFELLADSQKKWESLMEIDKELSWRAYERLHWGGTIMRELETGLHYDIYRKRALYLEFLYTYWSHDIIPEQIP